MNDAELIRRFNAGQKQVFNTLVWRWQSRLYNFVLRYTGDGEEARDLCQQSFGRAYGNLHRLRDPERFATWLYQIAANICRDHLRRQKPHISLDAYQEESGQPHPALHQPDDAPLSPATHLHHCELREILNRALRKLRSGLSRRGAATRPRRSHRLARLDRFHRPQTDNAQD
jgi:RNA polymerase sigma-70 factor (ECF subfamily)